MDDYENYIAQLAAHVKIERKKISETAAALLAYCEQNKNEDPLLGVDTGKENPFAEKKKCSLL